MSRAERQAIKSQHHPHSKRADLVESLEEYQQRMARSPSPDMQSSTATSTASPFGPFKTYADFRLSEISLQNTLPKQVVNDIITLINDVQARKDTFTLCSYDALDRVWEEASPGLTAVGCCPQCLCIPFYVLRRLHAVYN